MTPLEWNARDLEAELAWLERILRAGLARHFGEDSNSESAIDLVAITPPNLSDSKSPYAQFVGHYELPLLERVAVVLALAPRIRPALLELLAAPAEGNGHRLLDMGGIRGSDGEFVPTGETLAFVLGGADLRTRFLVERRFGPEHLLAEHDILRLLPRGDEPLIKAPLKLSEEFVALFTTGAPHRPDFGPSFPARYIRTDLGWDDLVLHPGVREQLEDIATFLEHGDTLMKEWGMAPKLRPGYRALFHGPPGVGKTITACLLGKATGRDVYKVDLSLVVSKYIGETEKNLGKIFDAAQSKSWILFFDEADALFGKRSETKDSHDRFANQEVAYLLQRIEIFDGVAILASNQRDNLDDAFSRRFESIIFFPMPRPEERLRIWKQGFSSKSVLEPEIDLVKVAREHELAGGSIMNVIRYASLKALQHGRRVITAENLGTGIRREYGKERKSGA